MLELPHLSKTTELVPTTVENSPTHQAVVTKTVPHNLSFIRKLVRSIQYLRSSRGWLINSAVLWVVRPRSSESVRRLERNIKLILLSSSAGFLLDLLLQPEDGDEMSFRKGRLSPKYMVLQPIRSYYSQVSNIISIVSIVLSWIFLLKCLNKYCAIYKVMPSYRHTSTACT
jgi:hypothetical protein